MKTAIIKRRPKKNNASIRSKTMIKVYSLNTCAPCKTVKQVLRNKNKDFQEIDCTDNPELRDEAQRLSGSIIMPVTVVDDVVISGLNMPRLLSVI